MTHAAQSIRQEKFSFTSSVAADVWSPKPNAKAYEWWYFDALSDDARDAVVIIFLDNFIFSPRYNRRRGETGNVKKSEREKDNRLPASEIGLESACPEQTENSKSVIQNPKSNVPAVAFIYYRDGKPVYRSINEFEPGEFIASPNMPSCQIGENFMRFESAPYGSGYFLSINARLRNKRQLEAQFEWLSIESDFLPDRPIDTNDLHVWNLVVARADVSGKIRITGDNGKELNLVHFRGTGYHDHNYDNRWLPATVRDWQWGRAHFSDSTAVFYRYQETGENAAGTTKLLTVRDGQLRERDAACDEQLMTRDIFGLRYPQRLTFTTEDDMRLRVKQLETIDSSFFYLRFLSEMTLTLRDGKPRKAVGITEFLKPKALKFRWLDWLVSMRIGRKGKGSFLP
jgi:carotenoid 1,2-hydratase